MKTTLYFILCSLLLGTSMTHGINRFVAQGESIQSAIDASSSGDVIYVSSGVYAEQLLVAGKAIEIHGQGQTSPRAQSLEVRNLSGTFRISKFRFNDLPSNQIIIKDCPEVFITDLNGIDLNATRSNLQMKNCQFSESLLIQHGTLKLLKSTITKNVEVSQSTNQSGTPTQCIILQSTIGEKLTSLASTATISYNLVRHGYFEGKLSIIGNEFNGRGNFREIGIDLNGTSTEAFISNNLIRNFYANSSGNLDQKCIGIRVNGGAKVIIVNNIVRSCYDSNTNGTSSNVGMGIFVTPSASSGSSIMGNIIYECYDRTYSKSGGHRLVRAPQHVNLSYNNLYYNTYTHADLVAGGVMNLEPLNSDPKFTADYNLQPSSPCINKGPPDPRYNDRDGSRNDIGMFGGHNFIPDGKTTDKPIVLGLDVAPIAVPVGGSVTIESTGATVK